MTGFGKFSTSSYIVIFTCHQKIYSTLDLLFFRNMMSSEEVINFVRERINEKSEEQIKLSKICEEVDQYFCMIIFIKGWKLIFTIFL